MPTKRPYEKDVTKKLARGEQWTLPVILDPDNAANIIVEAEERGIKKLGRGYSVIVNERLRKSYKK